MQYWKSVFMDINENLSPKDKPKRKLTTEVTDDALDAIAALQRVYRRETGRYLPAWKVVDTAILAYAQTHGITIQET
jgi:hypothetical protein